MPMLAISRKAEAAIGSRGRYSAVVFVIPGEPPHVEIQSMKRFAPGAGGLENRVRKDRSRR